MIQEPTIQCVPSSPSNEDEPTEPRLPAQRVRTSPTASILQVRHNGAFTVSIDEQGIVTLVVPGRDDLILGHSRTALCQSGLGTYRLRICRQNLELAKWCLLPVDRTENNAASHLCEHNRRSKILLQPLFQQAGFVDDVSD